MHVFYLHQYFATRKGILGTRSYEFGRHLVGRGHQVTMITSGRGNREFPVSKGSRYTQFETDGIRVVSVAGGYHDALVGTRMSGSRRMLSFLEFARVAGRVGRSLPAPDVVFATHTPLPVGLAGKRLGRYYNVPFVFEVRDLWPEALVNLGALKNPAVILWLRRMAKRIYDAAEHIVALSPGMKDGIVRAGVSPEKVTVIPNGADLDLFRPDIDGSGARKRLGLGERFAAVYFGAMGMANGLEYVIEGARILAERNRDDIVLVLHGSGGKRAELQRMAEGHGLRNVVFSDIVRDKEEVARIVAGCDVCLTIYRAAKEHTWSPNKMFDALAAGRPVVVNVPGWLGNTIEKNRCGRCVDPGRPQELADALEHLADNRDLCRQMGAKARALGQREFDRKKLAGRLENVLLQATEGFVKQ